MMPCPYTDCSCSKNCPGVNDGFAMCAGGAVTELPDVTRAANVEARERREEGGATLLTPPRAAGGGCIYQTNTYTQTEQAAPGPAPEMT